MKILISLLFSIFLYSCQAPLPPCEGTSEQVQQCVNQRQQARMMKMIYMNQQRMLVNQNYQKPYGGL